MIAMQRVLAVVAFLICTSPLACSLTSAQAGSGERRGVGERVFHVTSTVASAPGGLRQALEQANADPVGRKRIVFDLGSKAVIPIVRALPAVTGSQIEIDAQGVTLKGGTCVRADGRSGCSGLVVRGTSITIRNLTATGFTFDGISVIGPRARDVSIVASVLYDNLDDGIGISAAAQQVLVEDCLLTGNGFRTKGKGVLVFDSSRATLRHNIVRGNRDGVTVSRHAEAVLENNRIEDNFDKGLGVSGAVVSGRENIIARNGKKSRDGQSPPNADGLRVGLTSSVKLSDTLIEDNGDAGVVVMDDSTVMLDGGHIIANAGVGVVARDRARVSLDRLVVADNAKAQIQRDQGALILGVPH